MLEFKLAADRGRLAIIEPAALGPNPDCSALAFLDTGDQAVTEPARVLRVTGIN